MRRLRWVRSGNGRARPRGSSGGGWPFNSARRHSAGNSTSSRSAPRPLSPKRSTITPAIAWSATGPYRPGSSCGNIRTGRMPRRKCTATGWRSRASSPPGSGTSTGPNAGSIGLSRSLPAGHGRVSSARAVTNWPSGSMMRFPRHGDRSNFNRGSAPACSQPRTFCCDSVATAKRSTF
jgi:hypothetical protein